MTCSELKGKNLNQEFYIDKKKSFKRGEIDNHRWKIFLKKEFLAVRYFLQEMLKRFLLSEIETLESNWNPYDKIKSNCLSWNYKYKCKNKIQICFYFTQQQVANSIHVSIDYKPGDTGTYSRTCWMSLQKVCVLKVLKS